MFAAIVRCKHAYPNLARMQASCWSVENHIPAPDFSIEKLAQAGREYGLLCPVDDSAATDGALPLVVPLRDLPTALGDALSPADAHTLGMALGGAVLEANMNAMRMQAWLETMRPDGAGWSSHLGGSDYVSITCPEHGHEALALIIHVLDSNKRTGDMFVTSGLSSWRERLLFHPAVEQAFRTRLARLDPIAW